MRPFVCGWVSEWVHHSSVALYLVDTIAATVFVQSLSNFTCKLWMMRGGALLILGHGSKVNVNFGTVYKTLWTWYRLQFLSNHFQTLHASCRWWEEPYWFWVTGVKGQGQLWHCVEGLVGRIQTIVFAQSLSNSTCKLWMIWGGTLLILGQRVKGQRFLWYSMYKTLWTPYRL